MTLRHMSIVESWDGGAIVRIVPPSEDCPTDMVVRVYPGESGGSWASVVTDDWREVPLARIDNFRGFSDVAEYFEAKLVSADWLDSVKQFHDIFGHDVAEYVDLPADDVLDLRLDMLREELSEAEVAAKNRDVTEYVDGLIDAIYIALGGLLEVAPPNIVRRVFAEVHRANMSKVGPNGEVIRRDDGKILKPEGFTPPDVLSALFRWDFVKEDRD